MDLHPFMPMKRQMRPGCKNKLSAWICLVGDFFLPDSYHGKPPLDHHFGFSKKKCPGILSNSKYKVPVFFFNGGVSEQKNGKSSP